MDTYSRLKAHYVLLECVHCTILFHSSYPWGAFMNLLDFLNSVSDIIVYSGSHLVLPLKLENGTYVNFLNFLNSLNEE